MTMFAITRNYIYKLLKVRTHLQQVLTATAMNVVRVIEWLRGQLLGAKTRPAGRLMRLAPALLVSGALTSARVT